MEMEQGSSDWRESLILHKKIEFCTEIIIENLFLCFQINDYDFEFQQLVAQRNIWVSR
jgi:hypothetical protein